MNKIEIINRGMLTHLYLNGKEIEDVISVSFEHNGGIMPTLKIQLHSDVKIDTDVLPDLPDIYKKYYVKKE